MENKNANIEKTLFFPLFSDLGSLHPRLFCCKQHRAGLFWSVHSSCSLLLPPSHIFPLLQYGSFMGCKGYLLWHLEHLLLLLLIWRFVFPLLFLTIFVPSSSPYDFCPFLDMFFQRNWQRGHVLPEGLLEKAGMGCVAPDLFSQRPPLQPHPSNTQYSDSFQSELSYWWDSARLTFIIWKFDYKRCFSLWWR